LSPTSLGGMYRPRSLKLFAASCSFSIALNSLCAAIVADGVDSKGGGIRCATLSLTHSASWVQSTSTAAALPSSPSSPSKIAASSSSWSSSKCSTSRAVSSFSSYEGCRIFIAICPRAPVSVSGCCGSSWTRGSPGAVASAAGSSWGWFKFPLTSR